MNTTSNSTPKNERPKFLKMTNRRIIIAACILVILGYILMSGLGSTEQSFNPDIFSTRRIVVAPILCLAGYLLVIIGILFKK